MKPAPNPPCPCGTGQRYKQCCGAFHKEGGPTPPTPEALMRARYSAYVIGRASYIMDTTDPLGPHFEADARKWRASILAFSRGTRFMKLDILDHGVEPDQERGWVRFRATMSQRGQDTSFVEHSVFRKERERWLYAQGQEVQP